MSADASPKDSKKKPRFSLIAVAVVIAAVLVGGVVGAFAYRERVKSDEVSTTTKKEKKSGTGGIKNDGKPGSKFEAQFNTDTMYPAFTPKRHYYVSRCTPGKLKVRVQAKNGIMVKVGAYPPETGRFDAEARPLSTQDFEVVIDTKGDPQKYQIRCLPDDFPDWSYTRLKDPPKGMFFVSYRQEPKDHYRNWAVVFDQDGTPRWWNPTPTQTLGGQILRDGTFQVPRGFGDGFGQDARTANEVWTLDGKLVKLVKTQNAPTDGHEYKLMPNGNVMIMSYNPRYGVDLSSEGGPKSTGALPGEIQEVTPSGKVVWKWNSLDHVPLSYTPQRWWKRIFKNPHIDYQGRTRYDYFHLNSIEPWGKDTLVISTRHTDKVYGISRKTGDILWTFGGEPDPKSLKIEGDDPLADYPIAGNHDARISDGNLLSIHDNGTHFEGRQPRAVFYRIDLKNRTATYEGQLTDEKVKKSHCCGGVRPFGDGWIVAWGNNRYVDGFNAENQLAFRLKLPIPVYRAVPVPPEVTEKDLNAALEKMEIEPAQQGKPVRPIKFYGKDE